MKMVLRFWVRELLSSGDLYFGVESQIWVKRLQVCIAQWQVSCSHRLDILSMLASFICSIAVCPQSGLSHSVLRICPWLVWVSWCCSILVEYCCFRFDLPRIEAWFHLPLWALFKLSVLLFFIYSTLLVNLFWSSHLGCVKWWRDALWLELILNVRQC